MRASEHVCTRSPRLWETSSEGKRMAGLRPLPGGEPRGGLGTASSHRRQGLSLQPPGVRTTEPGSQAAARGPTTGSRPTDVSLASVWGDLFTPCPHCWPSTATKREQTGVGRCWGADPGGTRQLAPASSPARAGGAGGCGCDRGCRVPTGLVGTRILSQVTTLSLPKHKRRLKSSRGGIRPRDMSTGPSLLKPEHSRGPPQ